MLDAMPVTVMLSMVCIGAGAVIAALVGLRLPEENRFAATLALVLGAGIGVVVLTIGLFIVNPSSSRTGSPPASAQGVLLSAAASGLVAVVISLAVVSRRLAQRGD
jgi:Na+-driven multidrug efflux pump